MTAPAGLEETRTVRKRRAIIEAATSLFLDQGYDGTTMDQVAARAAVSKQTVYMQFTDKERLFAEVILGLRGTVEAFVDHLSRLLADPPDVEQALSQIARLYLKIVMQGRVLRLRRLLIGEAARFPELGRDYYRRVPLRTVEAIAACFERLHARGVLRTPDALLAAQHFAFLVLSIPFDRALVCGDSGFSDAELDRLADAGVRVFLAAYGPASSVAGGGAAPERGGGRNGGGGSTADGQTAA